MSHMVVVVGGGGFGASARIMHRAGVRLWQAGVAKANETHNMADYGGYWCAEVGSASTGCGSEGVSGVFALARCFEVLRDRLSVAMFSGRLARPGILLGDFSGDAGDASALGRSCQMGTSAAQEDHFIEEEDGIVRPICCWGGLDRPLHSCVPSLPPPAPFGIWKVTLSGEGPGGCDGVPGGPILCGCGIIGLPEPPPPLPATEGGRDGMDFSRSPSWPPAGGIVKLRGGPRAGLGLLRADGPPSIGSFPITTSSSSSIEGFNERKSCYCQSAALDHFGVVDHRHHHHQRHAKTKAFKANLRLRDISGIKYLSKTPQKSASPFEGIDKVAVSVGMATTDISIIVISSYDDDDEDEDRVGASLWPAFSFLGMESLSVEI
uniref:Uncharacterized protein n=1 Tax=Anopheles atroparvus TaxID=41427 RepID=A0A182J591_ANOAO